MFDRRRKMYTRRPWLSSTVWAGKKAYKYATKNPAQFLAPASAWVANQPGLMRTSNHTLSGEGFRATGGGASALPSRSAGYKARRQKKSRKESKARKLKGNKLSRKVVALEDKVKKLDKGCERGVGKMTYRRVRATNMTCTESNQVTHTVNVNRTSELETVIGGLKYFNPATPATLTTVDATAGTYQKEIEFKSIFSKVNARNNYQSDVDCTIYLCCIKESTQNSPTQVWTSAIGNDPGNVGSINLVGQYPTDFDEFRDLYSAKRVAHKILSPGQSVESSYNIKNICYDPAYFDTNTELHSPVIKTFVWMFVCKGVAGHDPTVATDVGLTQAGLDIIQSDTYIVEYDAGISLSYVNVVNDLATPSTPMVQSHQPIADNLGFSVP